MKHIIRHDLGIDLARLATRHALENYRRNFADYDPDGEWVDADHAVVRFKALGRTLEGTVEVRPTEVELNLDVPLLFRAFQSIAIRVVENEIETWLAKARAGELDDETE